MMGMPGRKWSRAEHVAQLRNVLVSHVVDVRAVQRNVLAVELARHGVPFRESHIAAAAWMMDVQESTMLQWRALLRYTKLTADELNSALMVAGVVR